MLSKSGRPGVTWLHRCTCGSGVCSCSRSSACAACTPASHSPAGRAGSTSTRSGRVLMKSPTMSSTPSSSGGRPATVTPNATSRSPEPCASSSAQAPCTSEPGVSPRARAAASSTVAASPSIHASRCPCTSAP